MEGGIGLNVAVIGAALTSVAMKRGDDSRRDRAAKAKGIAYGDHPIADARRGAVPEFDERQATGIDLQNREIGCRSEERRGGKECVSTCKSRWSAAHQKKKKTKETN